MLEDEESATAELRNDLAGASREDLRPQVVPLTPSRINDLSAGDLEALIAALFSAEGWHAILTPLSGDGGADVIAAKKGRGN